MKRITMALVFLIVTMYSSVADEGMWLLQYIRTHNLERMQALGFELKAEDIFSLQQSSMKDAVAIFGGGCTGEMVSAKGLLFTNHHCAIDELQSLSTPENDLLFNGFWAKSQKEEIPVPGLSVTFLQSITDVTDQVMQGASNFSDQDMATAIRRSRRQIEINARRDGMSDASVEYFRPGKRYYLFTYMVYNDVRLVGAPPNNIGQFGGDYDNWEWPNHNGDFAVFRVYTGTDGKPSAYKEDNIPYQPAHFFPISTAGLKEDDFIMVLGYPGSTTRYLTSHEIEEVYSLTNPVRAEVRGIRQDIWKKYMDQDEAIRLQYASKYFGSSNYWKYSIGQNQAIERLDVIGDARRFEQEFSQWLMLDPARMEAYGEALELIRKATQERFANQKANLYILESLLSNIPYMVLARSTRTIFFGQNNERFPQEELQSRIRARLRNQLSWRFDFYPPLEEEMLGTMLAFVIDKVDDVFLPDALRNIRDNYGKNTDAFAAKAFRYSILTDQDRFSEFLDNPSYDVLLNDPVYILANSVYDKISDLREERNRINDQWYIPGRRMWLDGLGEMLDHRDFYPDANFTMRLTYGTVKGYQPADGVYYHPFSTASGILEKLRRPEGHYQTDPKLIELLQSGQFGPYGLNGSLPTGFLSDADITGGNSGSPVINARGHLVGIAFDGNWEAMSSDIAFSEKYQRMISVDIRYVLYLIDVYGNAGYLLEELLLVD